VLGGALGKSGIVVDTHFARLARRFGWTAHTGPDKIERDVAVRHHRLRIPESLGERASRGNRKFQQGAIESVNPKLGSVSGSARSLKILND